MKKIIAIAVFAIAMAASSAFAGGRISSSVDRSTGTITVYCEEASVCENVIATVSIRDGEKEFCYKWEIAKLFRGQPAQKNIWLLYPGATILGVDCQ